MNMVRILLFIILLIAFSLRVYKLDQVPPSLNWDEAAAGYNAYTIANWGRDEWGNLLPLVFKSFEDDKHPVHIYITAIFVKLFGLSDLIIRLPSAILGIISVLLIYSLSLLLFKNYLTALLSALFLAISPYHIQFSRGLWESNFALSFFLMGLLAFYLGLSKKNYFLSLSFFCFGLSLLSYHSAKVVVPPLVLTIILINIRKLIKIPRQFYFGLLLFLIFIGLIIIDPRLSGAARVEQNRFSEKIIKSTQIFKMTGNSTLGWIEVGLNQYMSHFTKDYLFLSGDKTPRNSVKVVGQFYRVDALFLIFGLITLIKINPQIAIVILAWLILSPLPSSLVVGAPNANRAIFMLGSMILLSALGATYIIEMFKKNLKIIPLTVFLILLGFETTAYLKYYFNIYPKKDAIEWVYGMKQVTEYVKENPKDDLVFMTNIRSQPYIFFLYYLKIPLPDFLKTVYYNNSISKSYNTISMFDKYVFEGWDPIKSLANRGTLYILGPSEYDGLLNRANFDIKRIIYYPSGASAFYLVSLK